MAESTKDRLAGDLEREGLPVEMVQRARDGFYDDFHPNGSPTNQLDLHDDLLAAGRPEMAARVCAGEWDASMEESAAWGRTPEGQEVLGLLSSGPIDRARETDGVTAAEGELPDMEYPAMLVAAVEMVGRCGAVNFEIGHDRTGSAGWWAMATMSDTLPSNAAGATCRVDGFRSPEYAAEALCRQLMESGKCLHCKRPVKLGGPGGRSKVCRYKRVGERWERGCK